MLHSMSLLLLRFLGRLHEDAIHAQQQEASEKHQGKKSRDVWHPTVTSAVVTSRHQRACRCPWFQTSAGPDMQISARGLRCGTIASRH